jgi:hypothetical protein
VFTHVNEFKPGRIKWGRLGQSDKGPMKRCISLAKQDRSGALLIIGRLPLLAVSG